jgi:PAS domain S-box-containing protein
MLHDAREPRDPDARVDATSSIVPDPWTAHVIESVPEGFVAFDREWRYRYVNAAAERILGRARHEMLGRVAWEVFPDLIGTATEELMLEAARERVAVTAERPSMVTGGWLRISVCPFDEGISIFFSDITERRRAEDDLKRQAQRLDDLMASVPGVVWEAWGEPDARGQRIDFVSEFVEPMLGYSREEWLSNPNFWLQIVHPDDREAAARVAKDAYKAGGAHTNTFRWIAKDGRAIWVETRSVVVRDEEGRPIGFRGVTIDITERKRTEDALRFLAEAGETLTSTLDYEETLQRVAWLVVPIIADWCSVEILQEDGSLKQVALAHVDPQQIDVARDFRRRYPPNPSDARGLYHTLRTGESELLADVTDEMLVRAARSEEHLRALRSLELRSVLYVPIRSQGRSVGVITFVAMRRSGTRFTRHHLTMAEGLATRAALAIENARLFQTAQRELEARTEREQVIERHLAEIQALNERLKRAMSETHHRVKNNLQIIAAMVNMQVMEHQDQVPTQELHRLDHHIRALATIHDMLTYVARGDEELSHLSVRAAMERLHPIFQAMARGRAIELDVDDVRLTIRQGTSLTMLVNELVANAIKHGTGEMKIGLKELGDRLILFVEDDGPGFPPGFNASAAANTGLSLVDSLARWDLQGRLEFGNRPEGGARVTADFPRDLPTMRPFPREAAEVSHSLSRA